MPWFVWKYNQTSKSTLCGPQDSIYRRKCTGFTKTTLKTSWKRWLKTNKLKVIPYSPLEKLRKRLWILPLPFWNLVSSSSSSLIPLVQFNHRIWLTRIGRWCCGGNEGQCHHQLHGKVWSYYNQPLYWWVQWDKYSCVEPVSRKGRDGWCNGAWLTHWWWPRTPNMESWQICFFGALPGYEKVTINWLSENRLPWNTQRKSRYSWKALWLLRISDIQWEWILEPAWIEARNGQWANPKSGAWYSMGLLVLARCFNAGQNVLTLRREIMEEAFKRKIPSFHSIGVTHDFFWKTQYFRSRTRWSEILDVQLRHDWCLPSCGWLGQQRRSGTSSPARMVLSMTQWPQTLKLVRWLCITSDKRRLRKFFFSPLNKVHPWLGKWMYRSHPSSNAFCIITWKRWWESRICPKLPGAIWMMVMLDSLEEASTIAHNILRRLEDMDSSSVTKGWQSGLRRADTHKQEGSHESDGWIHPRALVYAFFDAWQWYLLTPKNQSSVVVLCGTLPGVSSTHALGTVQNSF